MSLNSFDYKNYTTQIFRKSFIHHTQTDFIELIIINKKNISIISDNIF